MKKEERCKTCGKLTMLGIDNGSALLWAHMWCKCSDESENEQGELAAMAWGLANAHAIVIKDLLHRVSLLEARE